MKWYFDILFHGGSGARLGSLVLDDIDLAVEVAKDISASYDQEHVIYVRSSAGIVQATVYYDRVSYEYRTTQEMMR